MYNELELETPLDLPDRTAEIEQFTFADGTPELTRLQSIASSSQSLPQLSHLIDRLPEVVQQHAEGAFDLVRALVCKSWSNEDLYLRILHGLAHIVESNKTFASQEWVLDTALSHIKGKTTSDPVIKAWLQVIMSMAPFLDGDWVRGKIQPLAVQRWGHNTTSLRQRVISTVLLCTCVCRFPAETGLLERLLSACQDTEARIRQCVASQMPALVSATVNSPASQAALLAEVSQLAEDDNHVVRKAAILQLDALSCLPMADRAQFAAPILSSLLHRASVSPEEAAREFQLDRIIISLLGKVPTQS